MHATSSHDHIRNTSSCPGASLLLDGFQFPMCPYLGTLAMSHLSSRNRLFDSVLLLIV